VPWWAEAIRHAATRQRLTIGGRRVMARLQNERARAAAVEVCDARGRGKVPTAAGPRQMTVHARCLWPPSARG
jgi:hypothetical protein